MKLSDPIKFFFIQLISYSIIVFNTRMIASANYPLAVASDLVFGAVNFFLIKKIAKSEDKSMSSMMGYSIGGAVGTVIGIYISKVI